VKLDETGQKPRNPKEVEAGCQGSSYTHDNAKIIINELYPDTTNPSPYHTHPGKKRPDDSYFLIFTYPILSYPILSYGGFQMGRVAEIRYARLLPAEGECDLTKTDIWLDGWMNGWGRKRALLSHIPELAAGTYIPNTYMTFSHSHSNGYRVDRVWDKDCGSVGFAGVQRSLVMVMVMVMVMVVDSQAGTRKPWHGMAWHMAWDVGVGVG